MAHITASVYTSHVPAIGATIDMGKTAEPYWQPLFKGYEFSKQWMKDHTPDVIFLVYNDHATAFSLDMIPTFAIGTAAQYTPADDGWGPRPVPVVNGQLRALNGFNPAVTGWNHVQTALREVIAEVAQKRNARQRPED